MGVALRLMEQLNETTDDSERTRLIIHAFETLEERYPQLSDVATQSHIRESELRLQKEIKQIEAKITQIESKITQVEANLRTEMKQIEVNLQQAIAAQTRWMLGGLAALGALFKLLSVL